MILTKENIAGYLLTLQLVEAGHHITYDEIQEMYGIKMYLEEWKYYHEYTMTVKQNHEWFKKSSKLVKKVFKFHPKQCDLQVGWLDLMSGLKIEG